MNKKTVAIVVGGGPAPGINGVIHAATIEAINRGHQVYGIHQGLSRIQTGDEGAIQELSIREVSRIHSDGGSVLGTSRANPTKDKTLMENVLRTLKNRNVGYLVTIGGDDTAYCASVIAQHSAGEIAVGHVPKTIDNDLPLPGTDSTFGFQSAREAGTHIVETLMNDAKTTGRWYLVIAMGRKAGHLALGIGVSAGATLTLIPEEFGRGQIPISYLVNMIAGSMLKRLASGRNYGVCVLAEGLAEKLDIEALPELANAERDPHGHIRFSELDFENLMKHAVRARLKELGVSLTVLAKNVGYELRCVPSNPFDREYTRQLGYGVIDFLLTGGSSAMITRQRGALVPMPFTELLDSTTGKTRIRFVDIKSATYLVARKYMIRLVSKDFENELLLRKISTISNRTPQLLKEEFGPIATDMPIYPEEVKLA